MKIEKYIAAAGVLGIGLVTQAAEKKSQNANQKPLNIVFILADDHAFQALSAYGHPISKLAPTPNIDRIAERGMTFTRATVENSISTPSRATILTGLYSAQHGQKTLGWRLNPDKEFFLEILQRAGYQTALFGKWHLQLDPKGFDNYKILNDQGEYYNPSFRTPDSNGHFISEEGYATDIITSDAINWLSARDQNKPFCLLVWHKAPHRNWMPDLKYIDMYNDVTFPEPPNLFEDYASSGPQMLTHQLTVAEHLGYAFDFHVSQLQNEPTLEYIHNSFPIAMSSLNDRQLEEWNRAFDLQNRAFLENRPVGDDLVHWKYQSYIRNYCRTIHSIDVQTGLLLDWLDQNNLTDNTVIIYSSDQGFFLGEHGLYDKRFMYEEGFRTPLLIAWPGGLHGKLSDALVQNIDYAPTILAAAGISEPPQMVGESLYPLLMGRNQEWKREYLYYHFYDYPSVGMVRKHRGVSDQRYKLIHWYGKGYQDEKLIDWWELYDLKTDPDEMHNVYGQSQYNTVQKRLLDALNNGPEAVTMLSEDNMFIH